MGTVAQSPSMSITNGLYHLPFQNPLREIQFANDPPQPANFLYASLHFLVLGHIFDDWILGVAQVLLSLMRGRVFDDPKAIVCERGGWLTCIFKH